MYPKENIKSNHTYVWYVHILYMYIQYLQKGNAYAKHPEVAHPERFVLRLILMISLDMKWLNYQKHFTSQLSQCSS